MITEPDFSALTAAVEKEDTAAIRKMVTTFQNVNQRELPSRQTALAIAAVGGRVKSLRTLLELGADPNLSDYIGMTPLMYAVEVGNEDAVTALVHAGANVAAVNGLGESATSLAKEWHRDKILPLLVAPKPSK
ncbi:MAG: ankyrin repeat domain-containing protein [Candidatus Sulfotelmatobacter sp.]